MTERLDTPPNIAIFCDYENVAIGAREAQFEAFDIQLVIRRLLDKGKVVVKKAYSDWERYKSARRPLHEAAFELIEIPHVSYSGKNSADIRLVVDALDLCYTKEHVEMFAIISGDSDFSPLVSKLRENDKRVIGIGVRKSSSDLLVENCDEFIYYDDLVREAQAAAKASSRARGKKKLAAEPPKATKARKGKRAAGQQAEGEAEPEEPPEEADLKTKALEMVMETVDSLLREREGNLWGSMVKQTLKRKRPGFSETAHGYGNFTELLEDAQRRGLLELQKDEKSGGHIILSSGGAG